MQSGTLLHLALLRKTSNAHKRKRVFSKNKNSHILQSPDFTEENYVLTGWCTQQNEMKPQMQPFKFKNSMIRLEKLRQSFEENKTQIESSRSNIKTSQIGHRPRNRCQSFRNYQHHRSVNNTNLQNKDYEQSLRQITGQIRLKPEKKYHKINISYNQVRTEERGSGFKENESAPQIINASQRIKSKKIKLKRVQNDQFEHNILNFNNIRTRNFFKF